jgi:putative protease
MELLAPAGDLEKLKIALLYGADAVYFAGKVAGLRAGAGNFSLSEIEEAVTFCRSQNRRAYLTVNAFSHPGEAAELEAFLRALTGFAPDGFIFSDPGVLSLLKTVFPNAGKEGGPELHLSTQASVTNAAAAKFWYEQGVRRIILARELSLSEIAQIRTEIPNDLELEVFVHGAMCMAYSGRCLLSNFLTGRDANRGDCAHTCRWKYAIVEEQRPGEYIPIETDQYGSYLLSSKDLCMLENVSDLLHSGIASAKIEGRMKSLYYVATIVRAYRHIIDEALSSPGQTVSAESLAYWKEELSKASHRNYTTGFFYGNPGMEGQDDKSGGYQRSYVYLGIVTGYNPEDGLLAFEQRGKFSQGEIVEIFGPQRAFLEMTVEELFDEYQNPIQSVPHAQQKAFLRVPSRVEPYSLIRKKL